MNEKEAIDRLKECPEERQTLLRMLVNTHNVHQAKLEQAIDKIVQTLFGSPLREAVIPDSFWSTLTGKQIQHLRNSKKDVLLSAGDVALLLGVSRQYIHEEIQKGHIDSQKVGKYHIVRLQEIIAYVKRRGLV